MFLKQVSYNWYLFRDITHSKAQNGTQHLDTEQRTDGLLKPDSDAEALKHV